MKRTLTSSCSSDGSGAISRRRRRTTCKHAPSELPQPCTGLGTQLLGRRAEPGRARCLRSKGGAHLGVDDGIPVGLSAGHLELRQVPVAVHPARVGELALDSGALRARKATDSGQPRPSSQPTRGRRRSARAPAAHSGASAALARMARCAASGARLASHGRDRGSGSIHAQRLRQRAGRCVSRGADSTAACLWVLARGGVAPCCRKACRRAPGATACAQSPPLRQARRIAGRVRRGEVMARRRRCTRDGGARLRRRAAQTGAKDERSACEATSRRGDQRPQAAYPAAPACAAGGQRSRHGRGVLCRRLTELLNEPRKLQPTRTGWRRPRTRAAAPPRCRHARQARQRLRNAVQRRAWREKRAGAADLRRAATTGARRTCIFVAARAAVHPQERVTQEGGAARAQRRTPQKALSLACPCRYGDGHNAGALGGTRLVLASWRVHAVLSPTARGLQTPALSALSFVCFARGGARREKSTISRTPRDRARERWRGAARGQHATSRRKPDQYFSRSFLFLIEATR